MRPFLDALTPLLVLTGVAVACRERVRLDRLRVTVNIPVRNEDPALLDRSLYSLARQTRLPDCVSVVDDGSKHDYAEVRDWWQARWPAGSELRWARRPHRG